MATEATEAKEEIKFATKLGDASKKVWEQSKKQASVIGAQATFLGKEVGANATMVGKEVGVRASSLGKQVSTKVQKSDWSFCACFGGGSRAAEVGDEVHAPAKTDQETQVPAEVDDIALDPVKPLTPEPACVGTAFEHAEQSAGHPGTQLPGQQQAAASIRQPFAEVAYGRLDNLGPLASGVQAKAATQPAGNSKQFNNPLQPQRDSVPSGPAVHGATSHTPLRDAVEANRKPVAWVPPPDRGWQTGKLREELAARYGVPAKEVQAAFDEAVSEKIADVLCFTYALIGGPMEDAAFDEAGQHNNNKEKLLGSYGAASTGLGGKLLTPEQRAVKERVLREARGIVVEEKAAEAAAAEDVEADEEARLTQELAGLPAHEALQALGVPGPSFAMTDIDAILHPMKNSANRNPQQQARRVATYKVAVQVFTSLQAEA